MILQSYTDCNEQSPCRVETTGQSLVHTLFEHDVIEQLPFTKATRKEQPLVGSLSTATLYPSHQDEDIDGHYTEERKIHMTLPVAYDHNNHELADIFHEWRQLWGQVLRLHKHSIPDLHLAQQNSERLIRHLTETCDHHNTFHVKQLQEFCCLENQHRLAMVLGHSQYLYEEYLRLKPLPYLYILAHIEDAIYGPTQGTSRERLRYVLSRWT